MLADKYDDPTYLLESWILYGIGVLALLLRWAVRIRTVGFEGFQGDDYLAIVVLACFTSDAVAVKQIQHHGSNVDFTEAEMQAMTAHERSLVSYGSKLQFLCWYTYPTLMWALKGCMLFFFNRLTLGLASQRTVKWMAYACGVTYIVILIVTSVSCLPYHENWATLPYPRPRCSTRFQDMYMVTVLNVLTDAAMLSIPLPLLWRLQVPLRRKLALSVMLLGGIFVIVAAIVRICMSLEAQPSTMNINRWGIRETVAGILAVNAPIIRPIFNKSFWTGGPISGSRDVSEPSFPDHATSGHGKSRSGGNIFRSSRRSKDAFDMLDSTKLSTFRSDTKGADTTVKVYGGDGDSEREVSDDTASEDLIIQKNGAGRYNAQQHDRDAERDVERGDEMDQHGGINVTTTYTVRPASSYSADLNTVSRSAAGAAGPMSVPPLAELDGSGGGER